MKQYKIYSFDLWKTLIKSHPEHKLKRAEYFRDSKYNKNYLDTGKILDITREVDIMCNHINECTEGQISSFQMYAMVIYQMGYQDKLSRIELELIDSELGLLSIVYLPVLYDDVEKVLMELSNRGADLKITSNTGFTRGKYLSEALKKLNIEQYFTWINYSDHHIVSKPGRKLFCPPYHRHTSNPNDTLHVGDNLYADGLGAMNVGFDFFHIDHINNKLTDLL